MRSLWRRRLSLSALNHVTRLQLLCHIPSPMIRAPWLCFVFSSSFPGRLVSISSASWWGTRAEMLRRSGGSSGSSAWGWVTVRHIGMLRQWGGKSGWGLETDFGLKSVLLYFYFFWLLFAPFTTSLSCKAHLSILAEPCPCLYICEFAKHVVYSGASRMVAPKISLQELQTHHFNGFTALFRRCDKSQNFISSPAY